MMAKAIIRVFLFLLMQHLNEDIWDVIVAIKELNP